MYNFKLTAIRFDYLLSTDYCIYLFMRSVQIQNLFFVGLIPMILELSFRRGALAWISPPRTRPIGRHTQLDHSLLRRWGSDWVDGYGAAIAKRDSNRRSSWGEDDQGRSVRSGKSRDDFRNKDFRDRGDRRGIDVDGSSRDRRDTYTRGNFRTNNKDGRDRRQSHRHGSGDRWSDNRSQNRNNPRGGRDDEFSSKIDMKGLETEGFVHIYGLAPTLSALKANRRDFASREQAGTGLQSGTNEFVIDADDFVFDNAESKETKPEAQYTPYLFLQDTSGGNGSGRTTDKAAIASEVKQLAEERGIPIHYTDKGSLNALSGNRPHQVNIYHQFETLST